MDSDARVSEMREQLMQIRAAAESTEEKLRSEVWQPHQKRLSFISTNAILIHSFSCVFALNDGEPNMNNSSLD